MKKIYYIYIVCALCTALVVSFNLGFSAGFASYVPIGALFGSVLLFVVAAPLTIYKTNYGLILGLIGCIVIIPFNFIFIKGIWDDGVFNWVVLLGLLMFFLTAFGCIISMKLILIKKDDLKKFNNRFIRIVLSLIPITLFILYLILYGKYWSWAMFDV